MRNSGTGGKQSVGVLAPELLLIGVLNPEGSSGRIRRRCRCACTYNHGKGGVSINEVPRTMGNLGTSTKRRADRLIAKSHGL